MRPLRWTGRATRDLSRLRKFSASETPLAARRAIAAIRQGVTLLASNPQIGRIAGAEDIAYREWIIPFGSAAYIVMSHVTQSEVVLLAIRHGREAGY